MLTDIDIKKLSNIKKYKKKLSIKGFTLVEILITIGVIGIIAAVIIPAVVQNVQDYTFAKAKENSLMKITEATKEMKSNDVLSGHTTNASFVDEFEKYMAVLKRCTSTDLDGCFVSTFKTAEGYTVDTSTLTSGSILNSNNISDGVIGLMLKNGTTMLFSLKDETKDPTGCARIDPYNNATDTTGCMSFLYDINGRGGPNIMGKDIGSISVSDLGCGGIKTADGTCFSGAFTPTPMTLAACNAAVAAGTLGITACSAASDYWAGAVSACGGVSKMPSLSQINELANYLYGVSNCGSSVDCGTALNYTKSSSAGLPSLGTFSVFSSTETSSTTVGIRTFYATYSRRSNTGNRNYAGGKAFCIGN